MDGPLSKFSASAIDLGGATFWLLTLLAVGLLTPIANAKWRAGVLALINLAFLATILQKEAWLAGAGLAAAYLGLRCCSAGRAARLFPLAVTTAMVAYKAPPAAHLLHLAPQATSVLSLVGFAYVFWRLISVWASVAGGTAPAPGPLAFINYVVPFHMLAAGPIVTYEDFMAQPAVPAALDRLEVLGALERIAKGLFKKFVVAALLQHLFLTKYLSTGLYFAVECQLWLVWLLLDFSAYTDIAIGIGILIGVKVPENFNNPLKSRNVIELWERWHMSLGRVLRIYLFNPLLMALLRRRVPTVLASIAAVVVTFLACGLWHTFSLPFLLWGAIHAAAFLVCVGYRTCLKRLLSKDVLAKYNKSRLFRWGGVALTYEVGAIALMVATAPIMVAG